MPSGGKVSHGHSKRCGKTPEYVAWLNMRARCYNPKNNRYHLYGGRGIAICDQWKSDFGCFLADVGLRPSPDHSLDRIDSDGDYEPGNIQWSTRAEQAKNRRYCPVPGKTMREVCAERGLSYGTVQYRRHALGWPLEKALEVRNGK